MRTHARQRRGALVGHRARVGLAGCAGAVLMLGACGVDGTSVADVGSATSATVVPTSGEVTQESASGSAAPTAATDALVVTVTGQGAPRVMTLTCSPPGGSHPMPQQACAALEAYLTVRAPAATSSATDCPRPGDPKESVQRVTVVGTLDGAPVEVDVTRADCEADWGALLAVIAPPNAG